MERLENLSGRKGEMTVETAGESETASLGERFGRLVPAGSAVSLEGGLGAGKTMFVKGMAKGLGVRSEVLSPTFILVEEYAGDIPLLHFDLYRLEEVDEVEKIGLFDAVDGRNIVVVEWGDRLPEGAMEFDIRVRITITGESVRMISLAGPGNILVKLGSCGG